MTLFPFPHTGIISFFQYCGQVYLHTCKGYFKQYSSSGFFYARFGSGLVERIGKKEYEENLFLAKDFNIVDEKNKQLTFDF